MINITSSFPTEDTAALVVTSMIGEKALSSERLTTGDQYFVFAVKTTNAEYVIRMTDEKQKDKFCSAIYWQEKLLLLGIPLARFIQADLDIKYSPFPALLMNRLPGDDLCNVYSSLTKTDKKNLANEMVRIQAAMNALPDGKGYGIAESYETIPQDKTWFDFILNRLNLFRDIIKEAAIFDIKNVEYVITLTKKLQNEFDKISPRPFLWDASERNVIVYKGRISGIVDVDDMCFGDPLFVIGLTSTALESEGYDTLYSDYWAEALLLNKASQLRLAFYRLFFTIVFMRKHTMTTTNNQKIAFNIERLDKIFQQSLTRVEELR
jgi:aminoglycoside phosphotransferase (APT) family kinase protein